MARFVSGQVVVGAVPVHGPVQRQSPTRIGAGVADARRPHSLSNLQPISTPSEICLEPLFEADHSVRGQCRIALSLRSTARRSGRWQWNPLAPNQRPT